MKSDQLRTSIIIVTLTLEWCPFARAQFSLPDPNPIHQGKSSTPSLPDPIKEAERSKKELERKKKEAEVAVGGADKKVTKALQEASRAVVKRVDNANKDGFSYTYRTTRGLVAEHEKGWKEGDKQGKKFVKEITDAGATVDRWRVRQERLDVKALKSGTADLARGAPIDQMWDDAVRQARSNDDNLARATQENAIINSVAQAAATAYGGPAGAAAYAAWSTYHATGDVNMAVRAGMLSAISSYSGTSVSQMPSGTVSQVLKKAALSGTMGGLAVAAAGGSEADVKRAFLASGGSVLIQSGQAGLKQYSPQAYRAGEVVNCISAKSAECLSETEYAKDARGALKRGIDGNPYVQKVEQLQSEAAVWVGERQAATRSAVDSKISLGKLPDSQAIPVLDNKYILTWTLGKAGNLQYGKPTVVMTYVGETPPFYSTARYRYESTAKEVSRLSTGAHQSVRQAVKSLPVHYICMAGKSRRTIDVSRSNGQCTALYRKEGGMQQTILRSNKGLASCTAAASKFVHNELAPLHCASN